MGGLINTLHFAHAASHVIPVLPLHFVTASSNPHAQICPAHMLYLVSPLHSPCTLSLRFHTHSHCCAMLDVKSYLSPHGSIRIDSSGEMLLCIIWDKPLGLNLYTLTSTHQSFILSVITDTLHCVGLETCARKPRSIVQWLRGTIAEALC